MVRLEPVYEWAKRVRLERWLSLVFAVIAVLGGVATFLAMTGRLPQFADPQSVLLLLVLDLGVLLCLGTLIVRRLVVLWVHRRRAVAGARLHSRLVGLFSLVAVAPSLIIAVFSVLLFDFGLQGWFSQRVSTAVTESLAVADAYLKEHRQAINADVVAMANDLNRLGGMAAASPARFAQIVNNQTALRALSEATVLRRDGQVLVRAGFDALLDTLPSVPDWALDRADSGAVVLLTPESDDRVRALVRLDGLLDTYLLVGRYVDPTVIGHLERTSAAVQLYEQLEGKRTGLIITFALVFLIVALLLLLAAAWVGLAFADRLAKPIGRLITAAERVGAGDLAARVQVSQDAGEIGELAHTFNRMTSELGRQQGELLAANRQIEDRRRFIEAVLSGVSSGVIGLDARHRVTVTNRAAGELLRLDPAKLRGRQLSRLSKDIRSLLEAAERRPGRVHERQITLSRGRTTILLVRVAAETADEDIIGYVVTFDDVTELLSAQRKAAWADVARRIAHEIKNPLTPIQLAAERLRRRYLKQIESDREVFETCVSTIIRQVGDIGRMVDEFSAFARMPAARFVSHDLREIISQAVSLQEAGRPGRVHFATLLPDEPVEAKVDAGLLRQALTNLLKNAAESIEARQAAEAARGAGMTVGRVSVQLSRGPEMIDIAVEDDGRGLPSEQRERLTEPYVTTREKGTGLGLAIVKKIVEEHAGVLELHDREGGGARVLLRLPPTQDAVQDPPVAVDRKQAPLRVAHGA